MVDDLAGAPDPDLSRSASALTCYYYRKAYYRSFWLSPPACTVADAGSTKPGGLRSRYTGETRFPLVLQNIHRYFWYFARRLRRAS